LTTCRRMALGLVSLAAKGTQERRSETELGEKLPRHMVNIMESR
jgi:hypothetical protein